MSKVDIADIVHNSDGTLEGVVFKLYYFLPGQRIGVLTDRLSFPKGKWDVIREDFVRGYDCTVIVTDKEEVSKRVLFDVLAPLTVVHPVTLVLVGDSAIEFGNLKITSDYRTPRSEKITSYFSPPRKEECSPPMHDKEI